MDDKLKSLYNNLVKDNYELPDYDTFKADMADESKSKKLHETLLADNYDIPDYDTFTNDLGLKKKIHPLLNTGQGTGLVSQEASVGSSTQPSQSTSTEVAPSIAPPTTPSTAPSEQPKKEAKTVGEWVLGGVKAFDQSLAGFSDALDYVHTSASDAVNQVILGKDTAVKLKKMREEGTLAPSLNPKRPFEAISDAINYTHSGAKPLPTGKGAKGVVGDIVGGTMGVVPDIIASIYAPEVQLPRMFSKLGIEAGSKFGTIMGIKSAIGGSQGAEQGTAFQKIEAPILGAVEGYMTGWMFDGIGQQSGAIGKRMADKLIPKVTTKTQAIDKALIQQSGSMLSNATIFGGYGVTDEYVKTGTISPETFATNAGMGIALGLREPAKLLYAKGLNALIATPKEAINNVMKSEKSAEDFAKESQDKVRAVEDGTTTDREADIASAKLNANVATLKAITDEITTNKDEVVKSVKNSEIDPKVQELIIDKINEVDADNDPKIQETRVITEKINKINETLEEIRANKSWDETRKEIESTPLKEKKQELKNKILEAYGQPVEKTEGKAKPKKEEKPEKPEFTAITSENVSEIEKNNLSSLKDKDLTEGQDNFKLIKQSINDRAERERNPLAISGEDRTGEISIIRPEEIEGNGGSLEGIFRGRRDGNRGGESVTPEEQTKNLLAPNGQKSNLSPELHSYVRTPEFIQKFGDWTKGEGSLVLDRNGEPLLVYSGKGKYHLQGIDPTKTEQKILFFTGDRLLAKDYAQFRGKQPVLYRGFVRINEADMKEGSKINNLHEGQQEFITTKKEQFIPVGIEEVPKVKLNKKDNASRIGTQTETGSQQPQGVEQGKEDGLHLRNTSENGVEAQQGEEIKPERVKNLPNTTRASDNVPVEQWSENAESSGTREWGGGGRNTRDVYQTQDGTTIIDDMMWGGPFAERKGYAIVDLDIPANAINRKRIKEFKGKLDEDWGYTAKGYGLARFDGIDGVERAYEFIRKYKDTLVDEFKQENAQQSTLPLQDKGVTEPVQKPEEFTLREQTPESEQAIPTENIPLQAEQPIENKPLETLNDSGGTNVPPTGDNGSDTGKSSGTEGEKRKMEVARKAVEESGLLSQDTKDDIKNEGIEYTIQKDALLDNEVEELVKIYGTDSQGLDQMQSLVTAENNKMSGDRRNWLTALLIKERAKQIEIAPDFATKVAEKKKLTDLILFTAEQGVLSGRETRSFKKIGEALQLYPDAIKASVIAKIDQKNKEFFDTNGLDKIIRKEVNEYFKKHQLKEQEYTPDVEIPKDKIAEIKAQRSEILAKLKESFKRPSGTLSSSIIPLSAEQVELVAKLVGNYVQEGYYRTEAIVRKIRKDWESITDQKLTDEDVLKILPKEVDGKTLDEWDSEGKRVRTEKQTKKAKQPKKPKAPKTPTEEDLVKKLLDKAGKIASRKQLENFVSKYLSEIKERGLLTDQEFRNILAEALGRDYISGKSEETIDKAAQSVANYNGKLGLLDKAFADWKNEYDSNPKSEALTDKRKTLNDALKEADKALSDAKRKYQSVQDMLREDPDFITRLGSLVQGGLLIPSSQIANIAGNVLLLPETSPAYMIAGGLDAIAAKTGETMQYLLSKIDPSVHPWLYRQINKWSPTDKRTIMPSEYVRGYRRGFGDNFLEGARQTFSVEGPVGTELMKGQAQRGVHPVDALMHLYKTATGEEKRSFAKVMGDLMEALPAGYLANAHFRGLNMFDLPFRGAGETGIIYEAFGIKWNEKVKQAELIKDPVKRKERLQQLKDTKEVEREQFYRNPDKATLELAKRQGAKGTFSQSTALSRAINSFDRMAREAASDTAKPIEASVNWGLRLLKLLNAPYVTVPINIMGRSLEMSIPVFPMVKMMNHTSKSVEAKGKGQNELADSYRRMAMDDFGNMVVAGAVSTLAVALATSGIIGWGSDDKKVKAAQMDIGREGLRFNADAFKRWKNGEDPSWQDGDDTYSLKRLGVLSVQLGSMAQAMAEKSPEEIKKMKDMSFMDKQAWLSTQMLQYAPGISLDQSIMTGINNMVSGLMGSEAEKDKWLVGMATALSTSVYPNTIANASQSLDGYYRETKDYSLPEEQSKVAKQLQNTLKDRMFMGDKLPTKISIWGEKIQRVPSGENPVLYGMLGIAKHKQYQKYSFGAKLYEFYDEYRKTKPDDANAIFPSLPTARTKVGWDDAKMTPEQVEQYQMRVGQLRAEEAETYFNSKEWDEATNEERIAQLGKIYSKGTRQAEAELFSWLKYKDREPEKWKILVDNDAVPMPYMSKKLGDYKLDKPDIEMLNNIALGIYADGVKSILDYNSPENIRKMKANIDEETGRSEFVLELSFLWQDALTDAKSTMEDTLEKTK